MVTGEELESGAINERPDFRLLGLNIQQFGYFGNRTKMLAEHPHGAFGVVCREGFQDRLMLERSDVPERDP